MNMKEVTVVFPNLWEKNKNGVIFSADSVGTLDALINHSEVEVQVTAYNSMAEYKYATGSPYRYSIVDPMFKVGRAKSFDTVTGEVVLEVKEELANAIQAGIVLPRALMSKVMDETVNMERMQITRLISIDIKINSQEDK